MSFAFAKDTVRKGLDAHSAIGLVCCALLYLICATGTAVVLYEEWQRFEQPDAPEMTGIAPAAVQQGIENVLAAESDRDTTTHLYVHMPTEALPRTTITTDTQAFHVDADGTIVVPEENAWAEFLLALHYRLNLPAVYGMTLVGAFGAMIVALSISGIVAHPRIFRDAFRLRARRRDDVATVDWHNRLAVWSLPFALAIALTGAMIGLFYVSGGSMAASAYGGDSEAAIAPIFGAEAEADLTPAPVADAVPALTYMAREYPDVTPYYVILHDPRTAGQHVQIVGEHERRLIFGEYYAFGPQGEFHGTAGMADGTVGQQLAASTYNLHFGNYGGLPVKIAYIVFSLALTVVVATGTFIWLNKRARQGRPAPHLAAAWWGIVYGVPVALVATFIARLAIGNTAPFVALFWGVLALTIGVALLRKRNSGTRAAEPVLVPAE
ncbi:PepSY-associated TM helix domain-containing protein [Qipengyuania flava]|uniref:PepSY-associated TM helix domain-containing protein n=1 Tax=Qipengyuania flava TaxID=192812 RepID=UPI001C57A947|nr:PepSY-associated TM helix domain-containing protein [Qipengyuania flava]MBW3167774.1 PepSY domain-containing protein [Qipengyuania flava]MBY5965012.1 PepSY domain-containing protein [Qipengyuania flava]MBY6011336.1 PepSY domain-containing protein [Qipengyuania flava]MBY6025778.1 PepSY domain-containing protein [Qipengyuania flava]